MEEFTIQGTTQQPVGRLGRQEWIAERNERRGKRQEKAM